VSGLLEIIRTFWPIFVVVVGLAAGGCVWWLKGQFASKAELERLKIDVATVHDHETRIKVLEENSHQSPTRQELQEDIATLAERMRGVEVGQEGIQRQLGTANQHLQILVERAVRVA
jgi:tRNA splicing ligase